MGFIELDCSPPRLFPLNMVLLVFVATLFSATTRVYLWEDIHSINITASLNLEIIFSTSYTCLFRIFSSYAYVCI